MARISTSRSVLLSALVLAGPAVASPRGPKSIAVPTVQFSAASQTAGEPSGTAVATLVLSEVSALDVSVPFTLAGDAVQPDDYTITASPAVIPAGDLSVDVTITLADDALDEPDETIQITLGAPTNAVLGATTQHTATVTDDDPAPTVSFQSAASVAGESAGTVLVTVELSAVSGREVRVPFHRLGTATEGADYTIAAGPLSIPAGQASAAIAVDVIDDTDDETYERVVLKMKGPPVNATPGAITRHRVRVEDDDGLSVERDVVGLRASVSELSFALTRTTGVDGPLTVQLTNTDHVDVAFRGIALVGDDPRSFQVSYPGPLPVVLPPGASTTFDVTFQPVLPGPLTAVARVRQSPAGAPPTDVRLSGMAIGPPGAELLVNAAPDDYQDGRTTWIADFGASGTSSFAVTGVDIAGTTKDPLYRTARVGRTFGYSLELPPGDYDVRLHAAEIQGAGAGQRVFDVLAEGAPWLDDFDVFGVAGQNTAYVTPKHRVTVSDGSLELDFVASVGQALVAALEIRSVPVLVPDATELDFGIVEQGFFVEQVLTVENVGLKSTTAQRIAFLMDGDSEGWGADFFVRIDDVEYHGGVSSIYYNVDVPFPAGEAVEISVFFEPTVHQENRVVLAFTGPPEFPEFEVELTGVGGADAGWGFLHPVLDRDRELYVDFDGNQREPVTLLGQESHTHEPGHVLDTYEWKLDSNVVGTAAEISLPQVAVGTHDVELTIGDDNDPPSFASDQMSITIYPIGQVPGVLCFYYDGSAGGASALLDNVPAKAQYVERLSELRVEPENGFVGSSPFGADVMVRMQAKFDVPSVATYEFLPIGGVDTRVLVDGNVWNTAGLLFNGTHDLEVRYAVDSLSNLPLDLDVTVDGVPDRDFDAALVHDETGVKPVIHDMPSVGTELGGNLITITGFGFYPKKSIVVHWGPNHDFTDDDLRSWSDEVIEFVSPPGTGTINVRVQTANGLSDPKPFTYDDDGPVPINFNRLDDRKVSVTSPTSAVFHPNGKLYVGLLSGKVAEIAFDQNWFVTAPGVVVHDGVSGFTNSDVLGITYNPFDDPAGPVKLYVAHGEHFLNGGGSFSGPSPYTGQVSVLTGPTFDNPTVLIDQLPTSNHDHSVNGMVFDNNGDLLICVGGNTNAGVKYPNIGDLPESPFAAAILRARTSLGLDFDGDVVYLDRGTGAVVDDQVFGESVDVHPDVDIEVFAAGIRNPYDACLTTWGYVYASDNGPNWNFGYASTGPNTQTNFHANDTDEILLAEDDAYYGHPNRNRGFHDYRQYVYRDGDETSDGEFTERIYEVQSSTNGMEEYRADTFKGQIRGRLLAQKWNDNQYLLELTPDKRGVVGHIELNPFTKGLDVITGKGGTVLAIDYSGNAIQFLEPNDISVVGPTVFDIHPYRAMAAGGTPFTIGGENFVSGQTTVTIDGVLATLTEVTPRRIRGTFPVLPVNNVNTLYDVVVNVGANSDTLTGAVRVLPNAPGQTAGFWTSGTSMPAPLGEVACAIVGTKLYLFGEGDGKTYAYDLLYGGWVDDLATRQYGGNHHACEVIDGKVYVFGGLGFSSEGKVQIYDPVADTWSLGAPMPWAGGSCNSAVIDGLAYVCGGIVGGSTVNNLSVYDPVNDVWDFLQGSPVSLSAMPTPVNHAASATDGSRLWVFGGRQGGNWVQPGFTTVQWYDPATDTWESSNQVQSDLTPMPAGRGGTGKSLFHRGEFYVFGGEAPNTVYPQVYAYDPVANTWRTDAPMPTARHGIFPVRFHGRVFLAGGGVTAGFSASDILEVFQRP